MWVGHALAMHFALLWPVGKQREQKYSLDYWVYSNVLSGCYGNIVSHVIIWSTVTLHVCLHIAASGI